MYSYKQWVILSIATKLGVKRINSIADPALRDFISASKEQKKLNRECLQSYLKWNQPLPIPMLVVQI